MASHQNGGYFNDDQTMHRLQYQVVICPKSRKRVLKGKLGHRTAEMFEQCCDVYSWELLELVLQPDHVELLIQLPSEMSTSFAVELLKAGSSRIFTTEFSALDEHIWSSGFWREDFLVESLGQVGKKGIRGYIRDQKK